MNSNIDLIGYIYSQYPEITLNDLKKISDLSEFKINEIQDYCQKEGIRIAIKDHPGYPTRLYKYSPRPYLLYYLGDINLLDESNKILGIVGPRDAQEFSINFLNSLFNQTSNYNIITVSGLANGIDTYGHTLSIKNNIPTIAILGGGLKTFLLGHKAGLIKKIIENKGLVISQFKLDLEGTKYTFPQRNGLIANIADLLLIPGANLKSGSLITADFCHKMKKIIYGYDFNKISNQNQGVLEYINKGIIKPIGIENELLKNNFTKTGSTENPSPILSEFEQSILDKIKNHGEINIEKLIENGENISLILSVLTNLEINGLIIQATPGFYKIK